MGGCAVQAVFFIGGGGGWECPVLGEGTSLKYINYKIKRMIFQKNMCIVIKS